MYNMCTNSEFHISKTHAKVVMLHTCRATTGGNIIFYNAVMANLKKTKHKKVQQLSLLWMLPWKKRSDQSSTTLYWRTKIAPKQ